MNRPGGGPRFLISEPNTFCWSATLQSMTGYGAAEWTVAGNTVTCEMRSVNSRFLEINTRLPKSFLPLEAEITAVVKTKLQRGKVDIFFDLKASDLQNKDVKINLNTCAQYLQLAKQLQTLASEQGAAQFFVPGSLLQLLQLEGVLESGKGSEDRETFLHQGKEGFLKTLDMALLALESSRRKEGEGLNLVLKDLLQEILTLQSSLTARISDLRSAQFSLYRKRLDNIAQSLGDDRLSLSLKALPDERLLAELTILVDKSDVEEELQRLGLHTKEFLSCLASKGPHGKKLDFLCQEMHREVNTVSSKLMAMEASPTVMALKQAVERIRQQIQNVE